MQLTIENLIDLRVIAFNAIKDLEKYNPSLPEAQKERDRKLASLRHSIDQLSDEIRDLQFEAEQLPFGDTTPSHNCDQCRKVVKPRALKLNTDTVIEVCPHCEGHSLTMI